MKGRKRAALALLDYDDLSDDQANKRFQSENELIKAYRTQRKVGAPESFDCIEEQIYPTGEVEKDGGHNLMESASLPTI